MTLEDLARYALGTKKTVTLEFEPVFSYPVYPDVEGPLVTVTMVLKEEDGTELKVRYIFQKKNLSYVDSVMESKAQQMLAKWISGKEES